LDKEQEKWPSFGIHTWQQCTQPAVLFMQKKSECPATTLAEAKTFQ